MVVPLFEQGQFLGEAIDSVVAAAGRLAGDVELIVVDDHSGDDSAAVAAKLLDDRPWLPAMLVRRATNGGLSVARNTGIAAARGAYVLPLDADNLLYPCGLTTLLDVPRRRAARRGRHATGSSNGSTRPAASASPATCRGTSTSSSTAAFIDAMALFRRTALDELGGYEVPPPVPRVGGLRPVAARRRARPAGRAGAGDRRPVPRARRLDAPDQ